MPTEFGALLAGGAVQQLDSSQLNRIMMRATCIRRTKPSQAHAAKPAQRAQRNQIDAFASIMQLNPVDTKM